MNSNQVQVFLCLMMPLIIVPPILGINVSGSGSPENNHLNMTYSTHRKLLADGPDGVCTNSDIKIAQTSIPTSGRPEFKVQINNTCASPCAPEDIHVHCGQFAYEGINEETFKMLYHDDCLVNGGKPLKSGESVSFTYSNSFMYPLTVLSVKFC